MISLQNLKMKGVDGLLDTKEKVHEVQKRLKSKTEDALKILRQAKFSAWVKSRFVILD